MGRQGYPPEFRRRVLDRIEAGRKVADIARDLGNSSQTITTGAVSTASTRDWSPVKGAQTQLRHAAAS